MVNVAEYLVPDHEELNPGNYRVEVDFSSYASGSTLQSDVEGAFLKALQDLHDEEPTVEETIFPGLISVEEYISPGEPPTHRAKMAFEVRDVSGAPRIECREFMRYIASAFLFISEVGFVEVRVFRLTEEPSDGEPPPEPPPEEKNYTPLLIGAGCLAALWALSYLWRS